MARPAGRGGWRGGRLGRHLRLRCPRVGSSGGPDRRDGRDCGRRSAAASSPQQARGPAYWSSPWTVAPPPVALARLPAAGRSSATLPWRSRPDSQHAGGPVRLRVAVHRRALGVPGPGLGPAEGARLAGLGPLIVVAQVFLRPLPVAVVDVVADSSPAVDEDRHLTIGATHARAHEADVPSHPVHRLYPRWTPRVCRRAQCPPEQAEPVASARPSLEAPANRDLFHFAHTLTSYGSGFTALGLRRVPSRLAGRQRLGYSSPLIGYRPRAHQIRMTPQMQVVRGPRAAMGAPDGQGAPGRLTRLRWLWLARKGRLSRHPADRATAPRCR